MVLVELPNGFVREEGIGVVSGVAPLEVVNFGISSRPLIAESQDELDSIEASSLDDVVQTSKCFLIVYT